MNCAPFPFWDYFFNWFDSKLRFFKRKKPKKAYTKRSDYWQDVKGNRARIKETRAKKAMNTV